MPDAPRELSTERIEELRGEWRTGIAGLDADINALCDLALSAHPPQPAAGMPVAPEELDDAIRWRTAHKDEINAIVRYITDLVAYAERVGGERCQHGWRGSIPDDGARIVTPCPACGGKYLFIGSGGHLTCASVGNDRGDGGCPSPSVEDTVKKLKAELSTARAATIEEAARVCDEQARGADRNAEEFRDKMAAERACAYRSVATQIRAL